MYCVPGIRPVKPFVARIFKPPPLAVTKQRMKIARAPIFRVVIVETFQLLEGGLRGGKGGGGRWTILAEHNEIIVANGRAASTVA